MVTARRDGANKIRGGKRYEAVQFKRHYDSSVADVSQGREQLRRGSENGLGKHQDPQRRKGSRRNHRGDPHLGRLEGDGL